MTPDMLKPITNLVTWSATYSVGIKIIDDQHKELFNLVNEMYNHVSNDDEEAERAYFQSVVKQVLGYVKTHFATEETIMKRTKFQGYAVHKKVHDSFILSVVDIIKKYDEKKRAPLMVLTHFIKDWILTHIAIMDKQYFERLMKVASRKPNGKLSVTQAAIACL
jgi:hemerythrin